MGAARPHRQRGRVGNLFVQVEQPDDRRSHVGARIIARKLAGEPRERQRLRPVTAAEDPPDRGREEGRDPLQQDVLRSLAPVECGTEVERLLPVYEPLELAGYDRVDLLM